MNLMTDMASVYRLGSEKIRNLKSVARSSPQKKSAGRPDEVSIQSYILQYTQGKVYRGQDRTGLNFAPLVPDKKTFWTAPEFPAKIFPALAIFLGIVALLMSVFPLLRSLEKNSQTSVAVLGAAGAAYDSLQQAQDAILSSDLEGASANLARAYQDFDAAIGDFKNLSFIADFLPQADSGKKLLLAAREATLALQYATLGTEGLSRLRFGKTGIEPDSGADTPEVLRQSLENYQNALLYLQSAQSALDDLDLQSVPADYRERIVRAKDLITRLNPGLQVLDGAVKAILDFAAGDKTYLILFQNNRELRATGGFIGTYGILRLVSGRMEELKIESVYAPDGQLQEVIAAPGPLARSLTKTWAMRDSNWFFDFPTSAKKAAAFLEKETGRKVDGVLAFTPTLFQKLLAVTGPIYLPAYDQELNEQNFVDAVQYQTSVIYDRKLNQPKKFLADFTPLLLDRLSQLDSEKWLDSLALFVQALHQKDLMVFSYDEASQKLYQDYGWDGGIKATAGDYLAVVNANVGGGKTDGDIEQKIGLQTRLLPDGSILNTLDIERTHREGAEKELPTNVDFLRIYVPQGSRLVSASGFDNVQFYPSALPQAQIDPDLQALDEKTRIDALTNTLVYEENGKTVFANWIILPPGHYRQTKLQYVLPFRYDLFPDQPKNYTLLIQRQAGAPVIDFSQTLFLPPPAEILWQYPKSQPAGPQAANFKQQIDSDSFSGAVFK